MPVFVGVVTTRSVTDAHEDEAEPHRFDVIACGIYAGRIDTGVARRAKGINIAKGVLTVACFLENINRVIGRGNCVSTNQSTWGNVKGMNK